MIISSVSQENTLTCRTVSYEESQHRASQHFQNCSARSEISRATRQSCHQNTLPEDWCPNLTSSQTYRKIFEWALMSGIWTLSHICCLKQPRTQEKVILLCLLPELGHFLKLPYILPGICKIWTSIGISSTLTLITSAAVHMLVWDKGERIRRFTTRYHPREWKCEFVEQNQCHLQMRTGNI